MQARALPATLANQIDATEEVEVLAMWNARDMLQRDS